MVLLALVVVLVLLLLLGGGVVCRHWYQCGWQVPTCAVGPVW